jgi:hypothetical protein
MSVWAIAVHVVPLGSDRERGNGVPDWWLEDGSRPTDTGRSVANTQRLSAWYAARRLAWLERVNSPYTAEVVSVAMHPLDGASVTDGVKVVLTSADAERALMHELEHALTRHAVTRLVCARKVTAQLREAMYRHDLHLPALEAVTRNPIRRTDVKHAVPAHVQDIARALGWDLPPVDVYTPWLAGDVAACGRLTAAWLTLGLRVLERERLIPDFLELARR